MNRIKELRLAKNLKQSELATMLGITQSALSGWETGRTQLGWDDINSLMRIFNVSADYLLNFSNNPQGAIEIKSSKLTTVILDKINYLCQLHCTTVANLESECNFTANTIQQWSVVAPSIDELKAVADYFELPLDFFLDEENKLPTSKNIIDLAERIQSLPDNVKELIIQQIKVFEAMDKK